MIDPLAQIDPLGLETDSNVDGLGPRYETVRATLKEYFEKRRIGDDVTKKVNGDASYLGGVVKAAATEYGEKANIIVEALATRHTLSVQLMETISENSDVSVKAWDVRPARGGSFPEWVDNIPGQGLVIINRSVEEAKMQLRVRALLDDGRSISMLVDIDLHNGVIERVGPTLTADQTFDQQLQVAVTVESVEDDALIKALAG